MILMGVKAALYWPFQMTSEAQKVSDISMVVVFCSARWSFEFDGHVTCIRYGGFNQLSWNFLSNLEEIIFLECFSLANFIECDGSR